MAKKISKYLAKRLKKRYSDNRDKILVINGVVSGYQRREKAIPLLKEDLEDSRRRIKMKRLQRGTLLEEIKKEKQEIEDINFLLSKLKE